MANVVKNEEKLREEFENFQSKDGSKLGKPIANIQGRVA